MINKKNKIRKRYILLIVIAILPLFKLIHPNDYCFGVADLILIGGIAVLFFVAFLVVLFYNLYKISLKVELFNYRPILIFIVFGVCLYFGVSFHNQHLFKTKYQSFITADTNDLKGKLVLFTDGTCEFELKYESERYSCFFKGNYLYNKDTLVLQNVQLSDNELPKKFLVKDATLKGFNSDKIFFKQLNKNELETVKTK